MAREVFAEDGFHGAAMEKIAARAGVTKPVLYQHFKSGKKELYLALLEADMDALLEHVSSAIAGETGHRRIQRGMEAYVRYIESNVDTFRLLFRETLGADPEFREAIDRFHDAAASNIGAIIAEETGKPLEESELLARAVMGMAEAAGAFWLDRKQPVATDELIKDITELAWRGLSGLPRRKEE